MYSVMNTEYLRMKSSTKDSNRKTGGENEKNSFVDRFVVIMDEGYELTK